MQKPILLFDFDGTIADTFEFILNLSNELSNEYKFNKIKGHEVENLKNMTVQEIIEHLKVPKLKIPQILIRSRNELHANLDKIQPIQGLKEVLLEFRKNHFHMGIITTNSAKNVHHFLKNHGLEVFDFVSSTSKVFGKNHSIKRVLKNRKIPLKKVLYVGDEIRDVIAAQKLGIKIIAVSWGFNSHKSLNTFNPDYLFKTPSELKKHFLSI